LEEYIDEKFADYYEVLGKTSLLEETTLATIREIDCFARS
jgi:hypothetical protein